MTNEEAAKMLTAKVECMERDTNGTNSQCNTRYCDNCNLCYAQGTIGQQIEALKMAIKALKAQDVPDKKNELKPCPFCGGEAKLTIVPWCFKSGSSSSGWFVKCLNCDVSQPAYMSDHDAVEAWNRRVNDDK